MNLETVFDFIKEKRGYDYPLKYKLVKGIELTKDELNVYGNLDLSNIKITSLPDNLYVEGSLDLYNTDITSLPENLHVEGDLDLRKTRIRVLPDNLNIGGSLDMDYTLIEELPKNLHIGGYLSLFNTPIGKKYSGDGDSIKKMIKDNGGSVSGRIYVA